MNPSSTCKVLNRIANRHSRAPLRDLQAVMDQVTQALWSKQELYYETVSRCRDTQDSFFPHAR